jgi:hypothetical protein
MNKKNAEKWGAKAEKRGFEDERKKIGTTCPISPKNAAINSMTVSRMSP